MSDSLVDYALEYEKLNGWKICKFRKINHETLKATFSIEEGELGLCINGFTYMKKKNYNSGWVNFPSTEQVGPGGKREFIPTTWIRDKDAREAFLNGLSVLVKKHIERDK